MDKGKYQVMPDLTPAEYEELKADIAARGVQVAVEFDEDGNVLDGHHRVRACSELGIAEYPTVTRSGMTDAEKRTHARALNMARRHLTQEQKNVKNNNNDREKNIRIIKEMQNTALLAASEWAQVAAMCIKALKLYEPECDDFEDGDC